MKREIKFRAWFPEQKEMHEWQKFDGAIIKNIFNQPDFCIIQQYTGLKDNNGVEIYESDILKHNNGETLTVKWLIEEGRWCADKWYCLQSTMSKCEVIGNIHENPELL